VQSNKEEIALMNSPLDMTVRTGLYYKCFTFQSTITNAHVIARVLGTTE